MSKKTKIVSVVGGLALGLTANFGLAQGQVDFEDYMFELADQYGYYNVANRNADGNPPYTTPTPAVPQATGEDDSLFTPPVGVSLKPVNATEIEDIVNKMTRFIKNNKAKDVNGEYYTIDNTRSVGLQSGMLLWKKTKWETRVVKNAENAPTIFNVTDNNLSWYPDYRDVVNGGMRMTIGNFHMGSMPFPLKGRLDIPLDNIKKTVDANGKTDIVWFTARASNGQPSLPSGSNFFEVVGFLPYFNNPISEFFGYFNYKTGDWKLKVVVDNNVAPPSPGHVGLNLKVYSIGTAIQE